MTDTPRHGKPRPQPKSKPLVDLAHLESLSLDELRTLWRVHCGGRRGGGGGEGGGAVGGRLQRRLLVREIAFRSQARSFGDVDAATRRLLKSAVRAAFGDVRCASRADGRDLVHGTASCDSADGAPPTPKGSGGTKPRRSPRPGMDLPIPSGARLVRTWRGRTYEVRVVQGGRAFVYEGETFRSLTKIARLITGTNWSGPRFFGLVLRIREPNALDTRSKAEPPRRGVS